MGFRGLPVPTPAASGFNFTFSVMHLAWTAVLLAFLPGCDSQPPAFTETRSEAGRSSDAMKIEDQGVERDGHPAVHDPEHPNNIGTTGGTTGGDADGDGDGGTGGSGDSDDVDGTDMGGEGGSTSGTTTGGSTTGGATDGSTSGSDDSADADGADFGSDMSSTGGSTAGGSTAGGADGGLGLELVTMNVTQKSAGKVDILWVVDTSGSMAEEQNYLGDNFNAMITQLRNAGHDFQTAVTTTDICQDTMPPALADRVCPQDYGGSPATHLRGSFVGDSSHKVLKSTDADLVTRFNDYVNQGIDGSGFEHGLKAAEMAITKSLNGQNEALVRSDAFLAVIVVSDEEDDGIGLSKTDAYTGYNYYNLGLTTYRYTEDNMITYLRNTKGEGKFSVSAITPTRLANGDLCSAPHSQPEEEGTQYIKAAQKTGGILQSICATNWDTALAKIGMDLTGQTTQLNLEHVPNVPTIKVYVNDVLTSEWTYNAGNNAVKFNSGHVPSVGTQIKITYYKQ